MANKKAKVTPAMPGNKSNAADLAAAIATLTAPPAKPAGGRHNPAAVTAATVATSVGAADGGRGRGRGRGAPRGRGLRGGRGGAEDHEAQG